ncbi:hypothetical protein G6F49_008750 [Rhizopus delemar]|uniref:RING-type E3 ubiquitin transferase n=2 Tax=Rhizopus TaxID=4842 RepID=A0A9P7CMV0_9FUNG|nr:hypothetical protein G6F54_005820 [Rhizopus delemar]KAG1541656.1 hypothetical protein G6F51_007755 [Rhizopus arrhizus]KAG1552202.1 hypothetical protein G6F49_008750 [Rhizopus delemar]KAG1568171.1 hypothetical protein G6F50_007537 [Rhizopus delemar]KAG1643521.1 hypothetical protein G6F44_003743 [Rhizopus delemar]
METSSPQAPINESDNKKRRQRRHRPRVNKSKATEKKKEESKNKRSKEEEDEEEDICFICTEPIDYYAVAPCDHRTCHMCTLRLRALYQTKNCAYCKVEAKRVVFTNDSEKSFEDYKRDDTPFYDKKLGIRFETEEMYLDTERILKFTCPDEHCEESFDNRSELKKHVKEIHKKQLCDLCLRNKKIFSHEHTMYTYPQLQKHHREGDSSFIQNDETGFTGHPECVFCKTRFYGSDELFEHCRSKHEQCHICVRQGIQHQYYANYDSLEKHFEKEHYLCMYQECLNNKFVVFATDIDLKAHEIDEHGSSLSRQQRAKQARVDVNLNYSGSNRDQRQQQQQQQQQQQRNNNSQVRLTAEDFPVINGSSSSVPLLVNQMASLQIKRNGQEEWPSLGNEGRSSPNVIAESSSSSSSNAQPGIISRQAAAFDRIADMFKNLDKMIKFRQYIKQYTVEMSMNSETFVKSVHKLCDKNNVIAQKVFDQTKDLISNDAQKIDMERAWNHKKNPNASQQPQVLVVNPKKPTHSRGGVWDKVALAAQGAGAFPPLAKKSSPWSSTTSSRTASEQDLQSLFPALPTSNLHSSRRADINALLKKNDDQRTWGESSSSAVNTDSEESQDNRLKKKNKKGKQVLFRVGL